MYISIVIPAYNEEGMIGECLAAVMAEKERAILQYPDLAVEIVVVDNASSDATSAVASTFSGVAVVAEPQKGLVYARKAGWDATRGEVVANIDADTRMPEGWLSKVAHAFSHDPELVALSGPYIYYDLPMWKRALVKIFYFLGWLLHLVNHHIFKKGAMLQGGNFVLRRDAWEKVGGFDTRIAFYGEDTDVAKRIGAEGRVWWTWGFPMHTSGRRLEKEGLIKMSWLYTLNHLSILWLGKPATKEYTDIRT